MSDDQFKAPAIKPADLKPGDQMTFVVLGPKDDKTHKWTTFYPADVMMIGFVPAPPVLEPRCEVELDHPDGEQGRMVGSVIAIHAELAWVEYRLGGHGLHPCDTLTIIRPAKK